MLDGWHNSAVHSNNRGKAGVHDTIEPGWNGGIVRQIFSDKFNPVISWCRFERQMNFLAGMKSDSRTVHLPVQGSLMGGYGHICIIVSDGLW